MPVGQTVHDNDEYHPPFEVFGPDTGPDHVVRDDKGQILGTKRFIKYSL